MKSIKSMKNYALALLAMFVMVAGVNAQARYKHMPRVKVDRNYEKTEVKKEKPSSTTSSYMNTEVKTTNEVAETPVVTSTENTTVASSNSEVNVSTTKTKNVVKKEKSTSTLKTKKSADKDAFSNTVKKSSKLFDVKKVEKSNMERWMLLMIIFFAAGLLLIILAIIFSLTLTYGLWILTTIFYIFGSLLITAGFVMLILGLTGVM